jgi:uncharacterized lipoprotein YmbA
VKKLLGSGSLTILLLGCVSSPDHFYVLMPQPASSAAATPETAAAATAPAAATATAAAPSARALLRTNVPVLVDRNEMVLDRSANGVSILQHQRWATALGDQVFETLARDIEARHPGIVIGNGEFDSGSGVPIRITVSIVELSARVGGRATLSARWRVQDSRTGKDALGSETFEADVRDGYASVASAFSACLGELSDRLGASLDDGGGKPGAELAP